MKLQAIGIDQVALESSGGEEINGKRTRFTADLKARIKAELEDDRKSVATLSREYGPSHSTIMGWKREWGLTRPAAKRRADRRD
jgi:transposase-like protein